MRIALDAMGGDLAPRSTVRGALEAVRENPSLEIFLIGNETAIREHLPGRIPSGIDIHRAKEVITPEDEPVKAVRRKKDSSLVVTVEMARSMQADAAISAGNTGALMAAGLLLTGRMRGIERPALAALIPNVQGKVTLLLDVGANMDAKPLHLKQYAIMGSLYVEKVLGYERPTVGLLNVGTEEAKGNELSKTAFAMLKQAENIRFIGNIEARELMCGPCDVLVCDGFVGNVALKALEGAASTILSLLKREMTSSLLNKAAAAILKPSLNQFRDRMDYAEYGGAPLLGLLRPVFKAHGSSDERAIKNAILVAAKFVEQDVNGWIEKELEADRQTESE